MAVQIIMTGPIDGYMLHRNDPKDIMVDITHNTHEGYRPAANGSTIRERLSLREFLIRIVKTENMDNRGHDNARKVDEDIRQVLTTLAHASHERADDLGRWLNRRYSQLIERRKLELAEHTMMVREQGWNDPAVIKHMERQGFVAEQMKKENIHVHKAEYPMTTDEAFRVSDEEVYYVIS